MAKYDVSFKVGEDGSEEVIKQLQTIQKYLNALTKGDHNISVDADIDTSDIQKGGQAVESVRQNVLSLGDAFQGLGSVMMGSGNLLQSFGSFFGSDIIGTATRTVTSYATILASAGLGKSIDRFDTMETFPKMMSMMGYDADKAAEAVNTLNDAVLGLPTSLSDIVEQAQNFTTITGDLEKGVKYAIAANNTFLAGGADTSQVYYGTKQLQDLMSAGELQSMEWQSLIKAMGPSWREIGKEMGYAEDELTDFRTALTGGEIDGQEFLEAMVRAATGTGKLAEMAGLSKEQIGSSLTNIQTAFASLGQSLIETLDDSFQESQGKTLAEKIQEIGTAIKTDLKPYLNEFVKDNFPKIEAFIDKLEGYDWMGMISKVAEWSGMMFEIYSTIITKIPSSVAAFGMTFASPLGKIISALGSFIYGLGNLGALKGIKLGGLGSTIGETGTFLSGIKSVGTKLVNSAGSIAIIAELGLVIKEYAGVIQTINDLKIGGNFNKNLKAVAKFMAEAGGITAAVVAIMSVLSGFGAGGFVGAGEVLSAGLVGLIAMTGAVITEYADVANKIGSMNLNESRLQKNIAAIGTVITELNLLMAGEGLITFFTGISELVAAGVLSVDAMAIDKLIATIEKLSAMDSIDVDVDGLKKNIRDIKEIIVTMTDDEGLWSALTKADITSSMSKAATNMESIMSSWLAIVNSYVENSLTDVDLETISTQIEEDAASIGKAINALTGKTNPFKALADAISSGFMEDALTNVQQLLKTWNEIQTMFQTGTTEDDKTAGIKGAGTSLEAPSGTFTKENPIVTKIKEMISEVQAISDAISEGNDIFHKAGSAIAKALDASSSESLLSVTANIQTLITSYNSLQTTAKDFVVAEDVSGKIQSMFTQLDSMFAGIPDPDYNEITSRLSSWQMFLDADHMMGVVTSLITLATLIKDYGYNALDNVNTFFGTRMVTFSTTLAEISEDDIDERVGHIQYMFDRLNILLGVINALELSEAQTKINQMTTMLNDQVLAMLQSLITIKAYMEQLGIGSEDGGIITLLNSLFTGLGGATSSEGFETFNAQLVLLSENLDNISLSIFELYDGLVGLQPIIEGYAMVMDETILPDLEDAFDYITWIGEAIPILSDAVLLFRDSQLRFLNEDLMILLQLVQQLAQLLQIDLVTALGLVTQAMQQMQTATTNLTEAVINLTTAVNKLSQTLRKLQQELKKTQQQMQQCTQKARELAAAINAIPDHKTVTIDIVTNGSVPTFASTGGYIAGAGKVLYRSKGGFTPKGTDTVPAMLTPGEYVMSKKAVDTFGTGFFQRLNHLDIKGAMARVGTRVNRIVTNQYSVTNQTTHDNHATVNQYITTNNEQFSYRRARRFVEAL